MTFSKERVYYLVNPRGEGSIKVRVKFEAGAQSEYLDASHMRGVYAASLGSKGVGDVISKEIIEERLYEMSENLKLLEEIRKYPLSKFKNDPFKFKTAERRLHIAIECVFDIGITSSPQ